MSDGAFIEGEEEFVDELKPGTKLLSGQYTIDCFLAAGGFGITYLAKDSLDRFVVIKECFPGSFCRRQNHSVMPRSRAHQNELKSIVRLFSQEASSLAKAGHPNIVGVHQVFEENNTAYMAIDYVQGNDLLEILTNDPDRFEPELVQGYLVKMLGAIKHVHDKGILHRDISPDNIIISEEGEPVLIDFGAAREEAGEKASRMLSALRVVKDGYSPQEFYIAGSEQGPSCDLYSLAASFYHVITGNLPPDSQTRLTAFASNDKDPYVPLAGIAEGYPKEFCTGLDKAMAVLPRDRMQSATEWLDHINGKSASDAATTSVGAISNTTPKKKSPVPVMIGGVAVAAAAGIGATFFSTSDSSDAEANAVNELATQQPAAQSATNASEPTLTPGPSNIVAQTETVEMAPASPDAQTAPEAPQAVAVADVPRETIKLAAVAPEADLNAASIAEESASLANPPAADAVTATSDWSLSMPFAASESDPTKVGEVFASVWGWLNEGTEISAVNGIAVQNIDDIAGILRQSNVIGDQTQINATLTTGRNADGDLIENLIILPVVQQTRLSNGVEFETSFRAGNWQTVVTDLGDGSTSLQLGDVIVEYLPTNALINERNSIADAIMTGATSELAFNVSREGTVLEAGLVSLDAVVVEETEAAAVAAEIEETVTTDASIGLADAAAVVETETRVLPFALSEAQPTFIETVTDDAPFWMVPGLEIASIDGTPVTSNQDILNAVDSIASDTISVGVNPRLGSAIIERQLSVPTQTQTTLLNGLVFATKTVDGTTFTEVASAPSGSKFKPGDVIVAYVETAERLDGSVSIKTILERELTAGKTSFSFALDRKGEVWVEAFNLAALGQ